MSDLSHYLKVEFYRAFTSKNFALTICLTFLLYLCSTLKEIFLLGRDAAATVPYFFGVVNNFNSLMDILLVISALCCATSFCDDWQNRYIRSIVARVPVNTYCASRVVTCFCTTVLAVFIGICFYIVFLSLIYPVYLPLNELKGTQVAFGDLLSSNRQITYLLCLSIIKAISCGMWGISALLCSAIIPDTLIVVATPLILKKAYSVLYYVFKLPIVFSIDFLSEGLVNMGDWKVTFAYPCIFLILCTMPMGLLFSIRVKQVVQND